MYRKVLIASAAVILFATACDKEDPEGVIPEDTAGLTGRVHLYNEAQTSIPDDGMTVTVENASPSPSGLSNSLGDYSLEDVPVGNRTLVFTKPAYGTYKMFNVPHTFNGGNGTRVVPIPRLGQLSTTRVTALNNTVSGIVIPINVGTVPVGTPAAPKWIRFFYGRTSNVSATNFTRYSPQYTLTGSPTEIRISRFTLTNLGFAVGDSVYIKAYGDSFFSNEYDDPTLSRRVFPNVNATSAPAIGIIVP